MILLLRQENEGYIIIMHYKAIHNVHYNALYLADKKYIIFTDSLVHLKLFVCHVFYTLYLCRTTS